MKFEQQDLLPRLEEAAPVALDSLDFGVIRMDRATRVLAYNRFEIEATGLSAARVIGRRFFADVAPCMDNPTVAGRFVHQPELDEMLEYVFALRLKPVPVRLRLLASAQYAGLYVLVKR
jgi:photoactive yellow protein